LGCGERTLTFTGIEIEPPAGMAAKAPDEPKSKSTTTPMFGGKRGVKAWSWTPTPELLEITRRKVKAEIKAFPAGEGDDSGL